jgi:hypothetical protein
MLAENVNTWRLQSINTYVITVQKHTPYVIYVIINVTFQVPPQYQAKLFLYLC